MRKTTFIILFFVCIFTAPFATGLALAQEDALPEMTAGEAMDLLDLYYENEQGDADTFSDTEAAIRNETYIDIEDLPDNEYFVAKVVKITNEKTEELFEGYIEKRQDLILEITSGPEKGEIISSTHGGLVSIETYQRVDVGDSLLMVKNYKVDGSFEYFVTEQYRITPIVMVLLFFVIIILFFGRRNGVGSLLGLCLSIMVLAGYIVPKIAHGSDPLLVTLIGTLFIAAVSLFLAHGFNRRTAVALGSTVLTLIMSLGLSKLFVEYTFLFGKGSEEAFYLQMGEFGNIDLRGLLLAGIVIGTLGVLDDITTAQTAVVGELRQANQTLGPKELYQRGLIVGREHIASLVNTLVLAYAGTSLPLFLLFSLNSQVPFWVTLNSERIAEEIIRAVIGSSALILAVPISTWMAVYWLKNEKIRKGKKMHTHVHS